MSQSFVMLKPESAFYLDTILKDLYDEGYGVYAYYMITNYHLFAKDIYYIANYIKDPKYYEIIEACIKAEVMLFGNKGLLLGVQNEQELMEHLNHLDRVKSSIRKKISLSKAKALQAFIDIDKLGIECSMGAYGNIQILSEKGELQEMYKANTETGNFVCFYLSYLHSIDADADIYKKSIDLIQSSSYVRQLKKREFEIAQRYKTFQL